MDKTQNDAPFVAFYDMHAVTFVPPDEMADVTIAGLQWFILIPRLNNTGSHRPIDSHSNSHVLETRKFVMAILRGKQGLLCDRNKYSVGFPLQF